MKLSRGALAAAFVACAPSTVTGSGAVEGDAGLAASSDASIGTALENDAGGTDGAVEPASSDGVDYVVLCLTELAPGDQGQALRFIARITATAGGQRRVAMTPLRGWDVAQNKPVVPFPSWSEARGSAVIATVAESTNATSAEFGTLLLPKEANSISGRDATIEGLALTSHFGAYTNGACATFSGRMTHPYSFTFNPAANTCRIVRVIDLGGSIPTFPSAYFKCSP